MKLIILLICIILQAFLNILPRHNYFFYFDYYFSGIKTLLMRFNLRSGWNAIIGVLLPMIIILLILHFLVVGFWFLYLIYATLVLLFCLEIREMKLQFADYFAAMKRDNLIDAQIQAEKFISHTVVQERAEITRAVTEAMFIRALTGIFSVIFWFFLLGPVGAASYYIISALANRSLDPNFELHETYQNASFLKDLLDWVPLRLITLTYALIGHFGPVFNVWVERLGSSLSENRQFNIDCGLTAIQADVNPVRADLIENELAYELIVRALWTWVIIIFVVKVAAWLI